MTKTNVQSTPSNSQRHDTPNNKTHVIKFRVTAEEKASLELDDVRFERSGRGQEPSWATNFQFLKIFCPSGTSLLQCTCISEVILLGRACPKPPAMVRT